MISSVDTLWVLVSTALVMLMVPGLALFYAGLVRDKNVITTIMHVFMKLSLITVIWMMVGYSMAFGGNSLGGFIGNLDFLFMNGVGFDPYPNTAVPSLLFAAYQSMFAVVTVAIITGSFAERTRLIPILIFGVIWVLVVYAPIAHWIWGGGWLVKKFGTLDFAGGAVVHLSSAVSGLVAAIYIGKRKGLKDDIVDPPHNIILTFIGAGLLWFGWFGFNAGSALAVNNVAIIAFVNTNIAGAVGTLTWVGMELVYQKRVTILGAISGAVSGLAAITPAAGFVAPQFSILIGFIAGIACYYGVVFLKPKFSYDDSLDAFGIHGIAGFVGLIAAGLFASLSINPAGADGAISGNYSLVVNQFISSIIVITYSIVVTYIILKLVDYITAIRVSEKEEFEGLDVTQHGEKGYNINF